jgi:hypothetical protein
MHTPNPSGLFRILAPIVVLIASLQAQTPSVYFGNLHSHTSYSDGSGTPQEAYAHARSVAHLDFLAVTEHNHASAQSKIAADHSLYNGSRPDSLISAAKKATKEGQFIALYGQEYSSIGSGNHANVLEVGEVIDEQEVPSGRWDKLFDVWLPAHLDSQNQPAIVLLNHPAQSSSPNSKEYGLDDYPTVTKWREAVERQTRLINIVNGPSHEGNKPGTPSENEFRRYLNLGLHVAPTADQDNHRTNWGSAADTRTGVVAVALTRANILTALRNRNVYATEDKNLRIIAKVNGELMGKRFQGNQVPQVGRELAISLAIEDDDEPSAHYTIEVFGDHVGGPDEAHFSTRVAVSGDGTYPVPGVKYSGGDEYFFIRVTQTDEDEEEKDRAWLAPVWFEPNATASGLLATGPAPTIGPVLTLEVDLVAEEAVVSNRGDEVVSLTGWKLVSVSGDQRFAFPSGFSLAPGASVMVTSGPTAVDQPPQKLKWSAAPKWSNSGDPGQLWDVQDRVRAESNREN